MIFVDSSVWIAYFNGVDSEPTRLLDTALGTTRIVVGDLVLAEVLQGFRADRDFRQARTLMLHLDVRSVLSPALALRAAEHYRFAVRAASGLTTSGNRVMSNVSP